MSIDVKKIRAQFPILNRKINGQSLVYFDNAATTLKPNSFVERISRHYSLEASNVHRGIHTLSDEATTAFEASREKVRSFLNAKDVGEIIFTRGTTDSINLVASTLARATLKPGDEVLISEMEHHSNIVPWQMACLETGAKLVVVPIGHDGSWIDEEFERRLSGKTKWVAVTAESNTLGTVTPIESICKRAHAFGAKVLIDGAQMVAHKPTNVQKIDCDFLAFSAHKVYGPTGLGVLFGKSSLLKDMPPRDGGGSMIREVTFEKTTYDDPPGRFEAGTPHIAGVIGFASSIDFIETLGWENIETHERNLIQRAHSRAAEMPEVRIFGTALKKGPIFSFQLGSAHPHDLGTLLNEAGIAIRTGHHCTQPLMKKFGVTGTARASFAVYNSLEEVDLFFEKMVGIKKILN